MCRWLTQRKHNNQLTSAGVSSGFTRWPSNRNLQRKGRKSTSNRRQLAAKWACIICLYTRALLCKLHMRTVHIKHPDISGLRTAHMICHSRWSNCAVAG